MKRTANNSPASAKGEQQRVVHSSAAATGTAKPTGAASSVFALAAANKRRAPRSPQLTREQAESVPVQRGVAMPAQLIPRAGTSAYAALFARLAVGDMVELPKTLARQFRAWARNNQPGQVELRPLPHRTDAVRGCWRVAPPANAAASSSPLQAAPRKARA